MSHKRLGIAAAIIALVLIIGFAFSVPHTRDVVHTPLASSETESIPPVKLHDTFKKGVHTITGTIEAPNACTTATASATLTGDASSTQSILVAIDMPKNTDVCLQLPTTANFSVTISAPAQTPITATVNDSIATTSVL
ncbi:MAG: hypothetical protein WCS97_01675 [Candidatus Paceibacterota bacterium]|jgi:hypothetical protein